MSAGDVIYDKAKKCLCMVANERDEEWRDTPWRSVYCAKCHGDIIGMPQDYDVKAKCGAANYQEWVLKFVQEVVECSRSWGCEGPNWFVQEILMSRDYARNSLLHVPKCAKDALEAAVTRDMRESHATASLRKYSLADPWVALK